MSRNPDHLPRGTTDSPGWRTIQRVRDLASRNRGGIPMDDRCLPTPYVISEKESELIAQPMGGETQGCKAEGTMVIVQYDGENGRGGLLRTCIDCDAVHLWPRFAPGADGSAGDPVLA